MLINFRVYIQSYDQTSYYYIHVGSLLPEAVDYYIRYILTTLYHVCKSSLYESNLHDFSLVHTLVAIYMYGTQILRNVALADLLVA